MNGLLIRAEKEAKEVPKMTEQQIKGYLNEEWEKASKL